MENNKYNKDNKKKKQKEPGVTLAFWLLRKAKAEGVSFEQLVVYQWIYKMNKIYEKDYLLFGKTSRTKLYECIAKDTGQSADGIEEMCKSLVEKGWMKNANGKAYNGKRTWGYLCLLDAEQAVRAKVGEQMEMEEMAAEVQPVVESSAQGDADMGERYQFGLRFILRYHEDIDGFIDNDFVLNDNGSPLVVPLTAPARPTKTAVWVNDPEGWFEPEEIPERESEY